MEQSFADVDEVAGHFDEGNCASVRADASSSERGTDDAVRFAQQFCERRGLRAPSAASAVERACERIANDARDEFKRIRNSRTRACDSPSSTTVEIEAGSVGTAAACATSASSDRTETEVRKRLKAHKYEKRLRNNRRSAHAAKVYKLVLRRALSHHLAAGAAERGGGEGAREDVLAERVVPVGMLHAVQQENVQLRMLLFQHGIVCHPFLAAPQACADPRPGVSFLSAVNAHTVAGAPALPHASEHTDFANVAAHGVSDYRGSESN